MITLELPSRFPRREMQIRARDRQSVHHLTVRPFAISKGMCLGEFFKSILPIIKVARTPRKAMEYIPASSVTLPSMATMSAMHRRRKVKMI